jgi:hypothetical protein
MSKKNLSSRLALHFSRSLGRLGPIELARTRFAEAGRGEFLNLPSPEFWKSFSTAGLPSPLRRRLATFQTF